MKKILILFVLVSVVFGLYSEENILWCKKLLFNDPTTHTIQKGDYFSKLSKQYYGTSKYWRELALINRAPNKDLVVPGEKVIIPGLEAIKKLSRSRTLTSVNDIVTHQEEWLAKYGSENGAQFAQQTTTAQAPAQSAAQIETAQPLAEEQGTEAELATPENLNEELIPQPDIKESSAMPIILTIIAVALIVGIMSLYLYRRKKKYQLEEFEPTEADEEMQVSEDDEEADDVFAKPFPKREREGVLVE